MKFNISQSIILILLTILSASCNNKKETSPENAEIDTDTTTYKKVYSPVMLYGIPADSFNLIHGRIKPNGFLSAILIKNGVSMSEIDQSVRNSASVFDVRNIKSGNNYILFCDRDRAAKARYLVYEH